MGKQVVATCRADRMRTKRAKSANRHRLRVYRSNNLYINSAFAVNSANKMYKRLIYNLTICRMIYRDASANDKPIIAGGYH